MTKLFSSIVFILLFFSGCSTIGSMQNNLNISVKHSDIYCWLNLMPGGEPSFHITGNLNVKNEESFEIDKIELQEIILLQDGNPVYKFKPGFEPADESILNKNLKPAEAKEFRFGVEAGLKIALDLNSEKFINAKLIFNSDEKIFEYEIDDIRIEKAY